MKKLIYITAIAAGMIFGTNAAAQKTNDHGGSKERQVQQEVKKTFDSNTTQKTAETTTKKVQASANETAAQTQKTVKSASSKKKVDVASKAKAVKDHVVSNVAKKNPTAGYVLNLLGKIKGAKEKLNLLKSSGKISEALFAQKTSALEKIEKKALKLQSNNNALLSLITE